MNLDRKYWTGKMIKTLEDNQVFVYGSNPAGKNGAGAAKAAKQFGAWYGEGRGLYGQAYALVTKNLDRDYEEPKTGIIYSKVGGRSVSPAQIQVNIKEMYVLAENMPEKEFLITYQHELDKRGNPIRSLNGYNALEMIDMFMDNMDVPDNISFHDSFRPLIENKLNPKPNLEFFWHSHSTFSQWHPSKFIYKEKTFISAEQFMMYSKAKLFKSEDIAEKILGFNNSVLGKKFISGELTGTEILNNKSSFSTWNAMMKQVKSYGRDIKDYNEAIWVSKRIPIVSVGSREKYNQNPSMKRELVSKGDAVMTEGSPWDKVWGIGLTKGDSRAQDPAKWLGLNLLGRILTDLKSHYLLEINAKKKSKIGKGAKPG
jgi:predicted NAD-dependent protein-ADP-ribosyltransferase YbiA (DUF1768 family)